MRVTSQPLLAVIWDSDTVDAGPGDDWLAGQMKALSVRGVVQRGIGAAALPPELEMLSGVAKDRDGFAAAAQALGLEPGAVFFVGGRSEEVNAAAAAGLRSFKYSRLARDVLARRLKG